MKKTMNKNEAKSNRSSSDYTELMVIKNLCKNMKVSFNYEKELAQSIKDLMKLSCWKEKKKVQDKNIPQLVEACLSLFPLKKEKIKMITWEGRTNKGTEDLTIHSKDRSVRISLKSIKRSGSGTLKNVGSNMFKKHGLDLSEDYEQMKKMVFSRVNKHSSVKTVSLNSLAEVKKLAKTNEEIRTWAERSSEEPLTNVNRKVFKMYKQMNQQNLKKFIGSVILDNKKPSDPVWVCLSNSDGTRIWNQNEKYGLKKEDVIKVSGLTRKGFKILKNGKPFLRVNTCCTNGKGLSAICQRYFYDSSLES